MKKYLGIGICLSVLFSFPAAAQKMLETLPADTVLDRVVKGFDPVRDFVATINAEVKMERMQIPKMLATMYFKQPDKTHFTSRSFLLLPRDAIAMNPVVLRDRFDASSAGQDTVQGRTMYKLQFAAKEKKTRIRQLYAWIDPSNWTVARLETIPYEGRTLSISFTYEHVQQQFWLPSQIIVTLGSTGESEKSPTDSTTSGFGQFEQAQRGMPRNGTMIVRYSDYKVNAGLDDSIFEKKNEHTQ